MHYSIEVLTPMQHSQIVQDHLIEQYLLNEMPAPARDEFEEHFFDCRDCATQLKATAAFLDATREELRRAHLQRVTATQQPPSLIGSRLKIWWQRLLTPGFAFATTAACLLVIGYQNVIVNPALHNEIATLQSPEVVPTLSLIGAASRGGGTPSVTLTPSRAVVLQVDIPAQPRFQGYLCQLYTPSQQLVGSVQVSPQQAENTVSLRFHVPSGQAGQNSAGQKSAGLYSLVVLGKEPAPATSPDTRLAQIDFHIDADTSNSKH